MKKLSDWDEELLDLDEEDSDKEAFDDEFGYGAGMLDRKIWIPYYPYGQEERRNGGRDRSSGEN